MASVNMFSVLFSGAILNESAHGIGFTGFCAGQSRAKWPYSLQLKQSILSRLFTGFTGFTVRIGGGNGASVCIRGTGSATGTEPNLPVN